MFCMMQHKATGAKREWQLSSCIDIVMAARWDAIRAIRNSGLCDKVQLQVLYQVSRHERIYNEFLRSTEDNPVESKEHTFWVERNLSDDPPVPEPLAVA